jgi:hypothetical protein
MFRHDHVGDQQEVMDASGPIQGIDEKNSPPSRSTSLQRILHG